MKIYEKNALQIHAFQKHIQTQSGPANEQRETAGPDLTLTTLLTARRHTSPSHTTTRAFSTPPSWQVRRWPTGCYTAAPRSTALGPLGTYLNYSDVQGFAEHSTTTGLRSLASMSPSQHTHSQKHISVGNFQENSAYRPCYHFAAKTKTRDSGS